MTSPYDTYDYPSYWKNREYEHKAELLAMETFLKEIPKIKTVIDIGSGFGRLVPGYAFRAKKIILADPSSRSLVLARQSYADSPKIEFLQSCLENLGPKLGRKKADLVILVRVLHHLKNTQEAFKTIAKLLAKNGYLILEFANKSHLKSTLSEFLKGNFTFPLDIFPKNVGRSKKGYLPFKNFHPGDIADQLSRSGFKIIDRLSVSNIRSAFFKKHFSQAALLACERRLQRPLSFINFGPSIFILCQKSL